MAFTKYDLLIPPEWNDIANFQRLLTDKRLGRTFRNTVAIAFGAMVGNNFLGLLLAMGVNRAMPQCPVPLLKATRL